MKIWLSESEEGREKEGNNTQQFVLITLIMLPYIESSNNSPSSSYSSSASPSVPLVASVNIGPNDAPLSVLTLITGALDV